MSSKHLVRPATIAKKRSSYWRMWRAVWHDTQALVKEFRRPLAVFLVSIFVGGYLYMLMNNNLTDNPHLEFVDMPYIMLALMVLEASIDVPNEPFLIAFWYLQPLLAVYIVGRGAADFVRLFFNRDQRRDAWEVAVASTYRKHIIVVGIGHVGLRVIRTLVQMGFEVVAIDLVITAELDAQLRDIDVPAIVGDGRNARILDQAGLGHAKALIIATSNDHINLEATMRVRDMNSSIRIVTRMWDHQLAQQIERFFDVEVLSASDLAAPAFAGSAVGVEITQTLHIAGIEYSMIQLIVRPGSFMDGLTVDALQDDEDIDIVLLRRDGGEPDVHPDGSELVSGGDTLVLFAKHNKITQIVARNELSRTR